MTPHKHPLCNDLLRAPAGSTDCDDLHIRREAGYVWSFWQPNAEELAALVMGGSVALAVQGATHPPLSINATTPTDDAAKAITPEESAVLDRAIRKRFDVLMKVTKKALSMLVQAAPPTPERDKIVDRFLDVVVLNQGRGEIVRGLPADPEPTERDIDRYRSDAEEWKAEAERWRKLAEGHEAELVAISEEITPGGTSMSLVDEIRAMKNEIALRLDPAVVCQQLRVIRGEAMQAVGHIDKILKLPELNPNPSAQ